jgi:lipopolysaccharide transport system permease protein
MSSPAPSYPLHGPVSDPTPPWVTSDSLSALALTLRLVFWPVLFWKRRDLVVVSVRRELQARFRGTLLGFAWVLVQPLLLFAVYAFIFTKLLGVRLTVGDGAPAGAMGVYMFTGILVWSAFAEAVGRSTSCIVDNRNLVQKVRFPSELLPLQIGISSLVTMVAGIAAFWVFTACSGIWPAPGWPLFLRGGLLLVLQLLLTTGLGLALSALHVFWRDTVPLVGVVLTAWMFATPIFWVPSPDVLPGIEEWLPIVEANPIHHLVYAWRELLMSGEPGVAFRGDFGASVAILALWAVVLFGLGSAIFFRAQRRFADEV